MLCDLIAINNKTNKFIPDTSNYVHELREWIRILSQRLIPTTQEDGSVEYI